MADEVRDPLRRKKIEHLDKLVAELDRDLARAPKLGWLSVASVPIGLHWGFFACFWTLVCVGSLVGVVLYILRVRKDDYLVERRDLEKVLAASPASPARG